MNTIILNCDTRSSFELNCIKRIEKACKICNIVFKFKMDIKDAYSILTDLDKDELSTVLYRAARGATPIINIEKEETTVDFYQCSFDSLTYQGRYKRTHNVSKLIFELRR